MKVNFTLLFFLLGSFYAIGCPIRIHVTEADGKLIPGASIRFDGKPAGITNDSGVLELSASEGSHTITVNHVGFESLDRSINVDCEDNKVTDVKLQLSVSKDLTLQEVSVTSLTDKQVIDRSPFSVQTINLSGSYDKGGDVSEFLNRASGVKLRTDGGIGAPVQINLGGLQGKAVRLFRDGIPMELFGHGFGLGMIPVNMLDRVEVYKGVMPLYLAADALGGGVNLVTRQDNKSYGEVSYEAGSFNTHRVTANALWCSPSKKWYIGTNSSFNYSDNNYTVNAPFNNPQTGSITYQDTKRFHDATRTYYAEGYAGVKNRPWADDLRLTLISSNFYKEIQNDAQMDKVYGQAFSREQNFTSLLTYKKSFLNERLKLNAVSTYSYFKTKFIDTATVRYGWDGQIQSRNARPGEINMGNNQNIDYRFFFSRLNLSYQLSDRHTLDLSEMYYRQNRKGTDPLGAVSAIENIDVLTVPATYRKDITALGLRSEWLDKELESIVALKYYHFNTNGYTTDKSGTGFLTSGSKQNVGYLGGLRWSHNNYLVKLSYEYATRLPDEYEVFGDARLVRENLALQPERSHNINLNGEYRIGENGRNLTLSGSLFYRKVKDGIFLQLDIPFNRYINYEQSEVKGIEMEANYVHQKRLNAGFNVTYQDIRQTDIKEAIFRYLEGARVPNVPYFFGNIWLNTYFNNIAKKGDRLELNWNANYVHRFFLYAIPKSQEPGLFEPVKDIQTSLIIPRDGRYGQFANNTGVYYRFAKPAVTMGAECRNIGNVRLYDNFNVQKPGRGYYLKLTYQFF
ncbi:TonB-dependent receptor plug domain-containing protein [Mucilaginibacter sp. JRF]|uniref:TonB-dependent receptor plug domain-containing protein n=1 Tax=Mucilaginibacter sp. JRF TaxID=2780088 RepID=UPI00187DDB82|nr:TonB-dependent receptor plug domain-containing protein [Mucilaginibacter sp. JRF]MBE9583155.1 TonB-dependent receptor plug domain-containing protein [Mucilaginibacter sp. JRF]